MNDRVPPFLLAGCENLEPTGLGRIEECDIRCAGHRATRVAERDPAILVDCGDPDGHLLELGRCECRREQGCAQDERVTESGHEP